MTPTGAPVRSAPSASQPLPAWLRHLTHLMALGWGTAEIGWLGARPTSFAFIGAILTLSEGSRAVAKARQALQS